MLYPLSQLLLVWWWELQERPVKCLTRDSAMHRSAPDINTSACQPTSRLPLPSRHLQLIGKPNCSRASLCFVPTCNCRVSQLRKGRQDYSRLDYRSLLECKSTAWGPRNQRALYQLPVLLGNFYCLAQLFAVLGPAGCQFVCHLRTANHFRRLSGFFRTFQRVAMTVPYYCAVALWKITTTKS